jgi:antitoxin (DNA-binding transcriptional repressor) of toxin-antitoxin stability system
MGLNLSKPKTSCEIALSDLRGQMSVCRRRVQRGEVIAVTYFGGVVGYLVPLPQLEAVQIESSLDKALSEFRDNINQSWEKIDSGKVDCLWLTYHDRRVMGFVAVRVWEAL